MTQDTRQEEEELTTTHGAVCKRIQERWWWLFEWGCSTENPDVVHATGVCVRPNLCT